MDVDLKMGVQKQNPSVRPQFHVDIKNEKKRGKY